MSWLALGLICAFLVLVFPARSLRRRARFAARRDAEPAGARRRRWLLADILFLAAFATVVTGPLLRATGSIGATWHAGAGAAAGAALLLGAAALATWAQDTMGPAWRPDIAADDRAALVTTGPFAIVRNPTYVAMLAAALGALLLAPSTPGITGLGLLAASLLLTVHYEETELARVHGPAYRTYRERVGRFLPTMPRRRR